MADAGNDETGLGRPVAKGASNIVGAAVQAALSIATGDSFIAASGGVVATTVTEEFLTRRMSRRERFRVGTALRFARDHYEARYTSGDDLRDDDFVNGDPSFFDESVEGALLAAQREHEERKLRHIGCLIANLPFEATIDRVTANWGIRIASQLSWNQYILLALNGEEESTTHRPRISAGSGQFHNRLEWSTWQDFTNLASMGLIGASQDRYERATPPRMLYVPTSGGQLLIELLCLDTISDEERDRVYAPLAAGAAPL